MSQQQYRHQLLWESMQSRFAQAILHFDPLMYHDDLIKAFESELDVLKAVIGRTRLLTGEMPPESKFMKAIVRVFSLGATGDWNLLRPAALEYGVIHGGVAPRDVTGLPQWWLRYPSTCLGSHDEDGEPYIPESLNDHLSVPAWDLVEHIILRGGGDIGMQVKSKPEGEIAELHVAIWRLQRAMQPMQAAAAQDWTDLAELFNMETATHLARAVEIHPLHLQGKAAMAEAKAGSAHGGKANSSASRGDAAGNRGSSARGPSAKGHSATQTSAPGPSAPGPSTAGPSAAGPSAAGTSAANPVEIDLDLDDSAGSDADVQAVPPPGPRRGRANSGRSVFSVDFSSNEE
ncbi:unnamed protein product [Peniophora sp. CBMAI 1063]|nr:unnamed protein product [Peniophora sp. CBMAI 1063]